ncbi:MAG TPA: PepSY domain-containing protein [Rhodanobacteraceae bacterium]|nr:PepSY domain-containing protein [Rhodanobacteraceae bacterium]
MTLALVLPAFAGSIAHEDRMEMTAVTRAPITPSHAIKIAEDGGGTAYGYGMESTRNGRNWYVVNVLRGGAKLAVRIDPSTGKVLGSSAAKGEGAEGSNALEGSKLTFSEAIAQAERVGHGPALEANAAGHGSNAYVDVDVIKGKSIAHYRVSARGSQIKTALTGTDS